MIGSAEPEAVDFAELARDLGITERERAEILRQRLITPAGEIRRGSPTKITSESARALKDARQIVDWVQANPERTLAIGVGIVLVLRLLVSGAIKPNGPVLA